MNKKDDLTEFMKEDNLLRIKHEKIENCVFCGKETPYTINIHIDYREYYVEGAGQLCKECYDKIYTIKND